MMNGGLETIKSKISPGTGPNISPSRNSTLDRPFRFALNREIASQRCNLARRNITRVTLTQSVQVIDSQDLSDSLIVITCSGERVADSLVIQAICGIEKFICR